MFEARALNKNTSFVRQAQAIRKGPPEVIAVLNMVGREYRLTRDMREAAVGLGLKIAETPITLRQAYTKPIERAQELLNKYGELMVKKGLLAE